MVTHFPCLWQVGFELPAAVVGRANGRSKERPSVARSVQFSVAIDTWATTVSEAHEKPVRGAGGRRFGPERPLRGPQRPRNSRNGEKGPCPPGNRERPTAPPGNRPGSGPPAPRGRHRSLTSDAMSAQRILASEVCGFQLPQVGHFRLPLTPRPRKLACGSRSTIPACPPKPGCSGRPGSIAWGAWKTTRYGGNAPLFEGGVSYVLTPTKVDCVSRAAAGRPQSSTEAADRLDKG